MIRETVLEYRGTGYGNAQVYIHTRSGAEEIYHGPSGQRTYDFLKKFVEEIYRKAGSERQFAEEKTFSGKRFLIVA